jgi:nickel transport protein
MDKDGTSAVRPHPPASELSSGELQALVQDAVRREVAPLKEELLHLNQRLSRPGLTEILGGLGYIVGLTGVALWAGGRRKHG